MFPPPCLSRYMQGRMNKWLWILLLATLTAVITEGLYTAQDIQSIVVNHAMPFWKFRRDGTNQYGVLLLLPDKRYIKGLELLPSPWTLYVDMYGDRYTTYDPYLIKGDVIVGFNYAAARTSVKRDSHTETQLLQHLPEMLSHYETGVWAPPAAVLLYTRGTPCTACTKAITNARNIVFTSGQFIVAYTTNMVNKYQDPTINCKNRKFLREKKVHVFCVKELESQKQCIEDDKISCEKHNKLFTFRGQ